MRHLATPQPMLIDPIRELLQASGKPWCIENVPGAPLRNPMVLCGTQFDMRIPRHRLFEAPWFFALVPQCDKRVCVFNPHRAESRARMYEEFGRGCHEVRWGKEMGVPWMNRHETREAIPPAYAEYIGREFLRQRKSEAAE